ncbi:MAG: hypothetical protein WC428_01725 [Candidatus Paceibacterota bacterium]|jgi:hypothetical protein
MINYHRYMLSFQTQPDVVKEMQDIINSGKFFSVTFIKKDGSIRFVNGHKIIYQNTSPSTENRGKFNRLDQNILLIWDNNRINDLTGEKGQYISVKLERLLFFKAGQFIRNFTEENKDVVRAAKITPEQMQQIKSKMKIDGIVQEEIQSLYEDFDYQKVLGKVIATTQQIIDKANTDDILAIEPDSTWESNYKFESIRLMSTQLVVKYLENNGKGWEKKTDITNLTQDRNNNFQDAKYMLSWIRRAIKKGYTAERKDMKIQDKLNLQEAPELLGIPELADYLSRVDPNLTPEDMQGMMQQEYQQGGDEAIRKFFYEQSKGIDLQILGRGKYAFKY